MDAGRAAGFRPSEGQVGRFLGFVLCPSTWTMVNPCTRRPCLTQHLLRRSSARRSKMPRTRGSVANIRWSLACMGSSSRATTTSQRESSLRRGDVLGGADGIGARSGASSVSPSPDARAVPSSTASAWAVNPLGATATRGTCPGRACRSGTPWSRGRTRCSARPDSPRTHHARGHTSGLPCSRRT